MTHCILFIETGRNKSCGWDFRSALTMWENISLELWGCAHMFCCLCVSQPLEISMCLRCRFLPRFYFLSSCVTFKFTRISEKQHSSHQRALQLPSHSHSLIHTEMDKSSGTACFLFSLQLSLFSVSEALICKKLTLFSPFFSRNS